MRKTFKYRLYPNKQQQRRLDVQLEERRWLDTELLAARLEAWDQRHESVRLYDQQATLPALGRPALGRGQAQAVQAVQAVQNVAVRLERAFQAVFGPGGLWPRATRRDAGLPPLSREGALR